MYKCVKCNTEYETNYCDNCRSIIDNNYRDNMNKKILKLISQKQDKVDYESNGFDFEEESNDDYPNSEQSSKRIGK